MYMYLYICICIHIRTEKTKKMMAGCSLCVRAQHLRVQILQILLQRRGHLRRLHRGSKPGCRCGATVEGSMVCLYIGYTMAFIYIYTYVYIYIYTGIFVYMYIHRDITMVHLHLCRDKLYLYDTIDGPYGTIGLVNVLCFTSPKFWGDHLQYLIVV